MKKYTFQLLIGLMSLSLMGIILIQVYWIHDSYQNNSEQFKYRITRLIDDVSKNIKEKERFDFYKKLEKYRNITGKHLNRRDMKELYFSYVEKGKGNKEGIVYSNRISIEDFKVPTSFFDKSADISLRRSSSRRKMHLYKSNDEKTEQNRVMPGIENNLSKSQKPDEEIVKNTELDDFQRTLDIAFNDVVETYPIEKRITNQSLRQIIKEQLKVNGINTNFEYGIYKNGLCTSIHSDNFIYKESNTYSAPVFRNYENQSNYQLYVSFPKKTKYLFSDLVPFVLLSSLFTFVIIGAYANAIWQLIKQRKISEIKTDFINNMTHEFKTPIATINLALDAIKNPKIINDEQKVMRYAQMIREENKRMHAQIENILRISKLEKRELDIQKEPVNFNDVLDDAINHVGLIVEDRNGNIETQLDAKCVDILANPVHFTNVLINILDNAIKYSPNAPEIKVCTQNIKDFLIVKIQDKGLGMSKMAQKRVFEKFYREHTGNVHNVKGHGLGLAYVKQIIDDHNGIISVESEKGKGSTFSIRLPLIN